MLQLQPHARRPGPGERTAAGLGQAARSRARSASTAAIWIAAAAWLAATAWMRPLALPDEGRYVGVAWEMLRSGDWAVPTLNGLPFFHKPPLFYWITAASMWLFGPGVMAARAAPLLGAIMAALSTVLFVHRWVGQRSARRALVVMLTMPFFYGGAQFANLDMLVAGCISAAVVLAAHAILSIEAGRPTRGALAGAFACAALGVLAKGLIGGVLPALVIVAWTAATRRAHAARWLVWPPGVALFAAIAAPWFVLMQSRYPGFFDYFFVHQHIERFAGTGFNNAQPWWYYLPLLAIATLPWSVWAIGAARTLTAAQAPHRDVRVLMATWLSAVVLFFSLPQSKLAGYILPALPPLAVLLAMASEQRLARARSAPWGWNAWAAGAAALCVGVLLIVQAHPQGSFEPLLPSVRARWTPGDRVLMIDGYAYDAPFYLRLEQPVVLVDTWSDPDIALHDNSRKEFHDAALFGTPLQRSRLIEPQDAPAAVCRGNVTWVIGKPDSPQRFAWLSSLERVSTTRDRGVWRWDAARAAARGDLPCP